MSQNDRKDLARFMAKVAKRPDGCWMWVGGLHRNGYGKFGMNGGSVLAHRWSYERHVGPIPTGLEIDHLCRVPACVNPAHLEPVTHAENVRRHHALETHCINGHRFTKGNTRIRVKGAVIRECLRCERLRDAVAS